MSEKTLTKKAQVFLLLKQKSLSAREVAEQLMCSEKHVKKLINDYRNFLQHDGYAAVTSNNGQRAKRWRLVGEIPAPPAKQPQVELSEEELDRRHRAHYRMGTKTKHLEGVWPPKTQPKRAK